MNFTNIPRSLIYEDRKSLDDFDIHNAESLNGALYKLLRRHLYTEYGLNNYRTLIIQMFNESYYLCTMFLMDKNADANFRDYIEAVMINSPYPDNIMDMCRRMVYAMCYALLEKIALRSHEIRTIRRHLRNCSYEYLPMIGETVDAVHPNEGEFRPVELTNDLLSKVDWKEATDGYDIDKVTFVVESLGNNNRVKRNLIIAIYSSLSTNGNMSKIPYKVDGLLFKAYEKFGGDQEELLNLNEKYMLREKKTDLTSRITTLEQEKMSLLKRIDDLQKRNTMLTQEKLVLHDKLIALQNTYDKVHVDKIEHQRREDELQKKLAEMNRKVMSFSDKVGTKTIQLKSLVDGLKRYVKIRGIEKGKDTFFSLHFILMSEPAWTNNVRELEDFFIRYEEDNKKPLLQLDNQNGGIVQITKPE